MIGSEGDGPWLIRLTVRKFEEIEPDAATIDSILQANGSTQMYLIQDRKRKHVLR